MPRLLPPAVRRRGGCRRPRAPELPPSSSARAGGCSARRRRSGAAVCEQPEPGTAARWQEGTVPAAPPALLGRGRSKEGAPPPAPGSLPPALPPPPTHGTDHSDLFFQARGQRFPSSSLLHPWDPPGPCWAPAANQLLASTTGGNWGAFPPWAMTQHRQQCDIPHPVPSVPQDPARTAPFPAGNSSQEGQRAFVLRDGAASRSQGLAAPGENQVWDQSDQ